MTQFACRAACHCVTGSYSHGHWEVSEDAPCPVAVAPRSRPRTLAALSFHQAQQLPHATSTSCSLPVCKPNHKSAPPPQAPTPTPTASQESESLGVMHTCIQHPQGLERSPPSPSRERKAEGEARAGQQAQAHPAPPMPCMLARLLRRGRLAAAHSLAPESALSSPLLDMLTMCARSREGRWPQPRTRLCGAQGRRTERRAR